MAEVIAEPTPEPEPIQATDEAAPVSEKAQVIEEPAAMTEPSETPAAEKKAKPARKNWFSKTA